MTDLNKIARESRHGSRSEREIFRLKARFLSAIDKPNGDSGCWLWTGYKIDGYGRIHYDGSQRLATHLALELFRDGIGPGLLACHRCDNPACVNPEHLFVGTHRDNAHDSIDKGRSANRGKLTPEQIDEIRSLPAIKRGELTEVAGKYGVSPSYISALRSRGEHKSPIAAVALRIRNENDITGRIAKALREKSGMSQSEFWGAYAVTQPGGCRYEAGKFSIPTPIKRLIFAEHVAGLRLDASTDDGAAGVLRLGRQD